MGKAGSYACAQAMRPALIDTWDICLKPWKYIEWRSMPNADHAIAPVVPEAHESLEDG
jgi:hypothetical protein